LTSPLSYAMLCVFFRCVSAVISDWCINNNSNKKVARNTYIVILML
jgi:hypothetical protein